jgi:hypothetical protein
MLIRCPECGEQISNQAETCPKCGVPNPAAGRALVLARRHAKRRKVTLRAAGVICTAVLCLSIVIGLVRFRWPVRYDIGTVSGTAAITQDRFESLVAQAASMWNTAASRTILWRFPLGRPVRVSLAVDTGREDYAVMREKIELRLQEARASLASVQATYDAYVATHPSPPPNNRFSYYVDSGAREVGHMESFVSGVEDELAELDDARADGRLPGPKDTYITFSPDGVAAPAEMTGLVTITAYMDDTQLLVSVLHALGHTLGLQDNSDDDVMSSTGVSRTISQDAAGSLHGWWK